MTTIAVIAHAGKSIEGGLPQLRRELASHGVTHPLWVEVPKSKKAPKQVRRLLKKGADHFFIWGGDGMAQRCIDALAGSAPRSPSSRLARPTCWRPTSVSPSRSRERWRPDCAASPA